MSASIRPSSSPSAFCILSSAFPPSNLRPSTFDVRPPSARDLLAYQRVVVDGASTRHVAEELGISQTRVRQIAQRVIDWLEQTLPESSETSDAAKIRLAQHIAADRLDRYLREADEAWRQTREIKYANLILRILAAQTRLPALPGTLEALLVDALPEDPASQPEICNPNSEIDPPNLQPSTFDHRPLSPPLRACSPDTMLADDDPDQQQSHSTVISSSQTTSTKLPPTQQAARAAFFTPAHSRQSPAEITSVTQLKITPTRIDITTNKPLNRHDRRRLKSLAAKK